MTLKWHQMTSFLPQKLWFGHVDLYYNYIILWINSGWLLQRVTAISLKSLEVTIYMEWRWWRKITRNEWKLRCAVCIWTKSTNSQCGEQQYVAWWYWVGKKVGGGNYWQNLKFKLVSSKFRLVSSFVNALLT